MKALILSLKISILYFLIINQTSAQVVSNFILTQINTGDAEVTFTNKSTGLNLSYNWTFGDGTTSTLKDPIHKYLNNGEYKVCLDIKGTLNQTDYFCQNVIVNVTQPPCLASFTPQFDASGLGVTFNNTSIGTGTHKYFWNLGNNLTSKDTTPYIVYDNVGQYNVCLEMTVVESGCSNIKCTPIYVNGGNAEICYAKFSFIKDSLKINFTNESKPLDAKVNWSFGDGTYSNLSNPIHIYKTSGQYEVCLNVEDPLTGKTNVQCQTIQAGIIKLCKADFSFFIDEPTLKVSFKNQSSGSYTGINWNFGDGTYSSLTEDVHIYKPNAYNACLIIEDKYSGCTDQICKDFTIGKTITCVAGFTFFIDNTTRYVKFTNTSNTSNIKSFWEFGDGKTATTFNSENTYKSEGLYPVTLTIYDTITQCQNKYSLQIQIGESILKPEFTYSVKDSVVSFNDATIGNVGEWYWTFGDGQVSKIKNPSIKYEKLGIYKVCLTITNPLTKIQYSVYKEIQIGTLPLFADFSYVIDQTTKIVYFTDLSKGGSTAWSWNFGDGMLEKSNNPKHIYTHDGNYTVCLSVFNETNNQQAQTCKDFNIGISTPTCKADFTYSVDANDSINFTDASQGDITTWYWTLGNGNYYKDKLFKYKFEKDGVYNVCLYVYNQANQCKAEICKEVILGNNPCKASFSTFIIDSLKLIRLTNTSIGTITSCYWTLGDGTTSTQPEVKHIYKEAGIYKVSLSIKGETAGCVDTYIQEIQIGEVACKANFEYRVNATTNSVEFSNTSIGTIDKVFWKFSNDIVSTDLNPIIKFDKPGLYYASLIIANSTCENYIEKTIQVGNVDCGAQFKVFIDSLSKVVYFTNTVLGTSTNLYWNFGDGNTSTELNPKHSYVAPGYYKITLNTMNKTTGCMDANTQVMLIGNEGKDCNADFVFQIDPTTRNISCFDKSYIGKQKANFWDFGERNGITLNGSDASYTYKADGFYNVCLTVYDSATKCKNMRCEYIKIGEDTTRCLAKFIYSLDSINKTVYFTDKSLGKPIEWNWYFGDNSTSTLQNPSHTYADTGFYKVYVVASNPANNCKSDFINVVNINTGRSKIKASYNYTIIANTKGVFPVEFKGASYGDPSEYEWDFGDGESNSSSLSPTHDYTSEGTYDACLTAIDGIVGDTDVYCQQVNLTLTGITIKQYTVSYLISYPNPLKNSNTISFNLPQAGEISIVVYNHIGQVVTTLLNGYILAGTHTLKWNTSTLTAGIYYVQLKNNNTLISKKLIKIE